MERFAHLTKVSNGYLITFTKTPKFEDGACVVVPNKKAARAMAERFNAKPWNF